MSVEILEQSHGKLLELNVSGKLSAAEYEHFLPIIESKIKEFGKLRVLVVLSDFHGWDAGALWDDLKFDFKHFSDIERLAIVGESKWEQGMAVFCKPFTTAKIQYFDHTKMTEAKVWINSVD